MEITVWEYVRDVLWLLSYFINSLPEVFLRKGVPKICSKFPREHPGRSVILIRLLCKFITITLRHGCSPVNLLHIFRTSLSTYELLLPPGIKGLSKHFVFIAWKDLSSLLGFLRLFFVTWIDLAHKLVLMQRLVWFRCSCPEVTFYTFYTCDGSLWMAASVDYWVFEEFNAIDSDWNLK